MVNKTWRSVGYVTFLLVLLYFFGTFLYEALRTQYIYSCGNWTYFCAKYTFDETIMMNQHITLLEIRLAITLFALALWGWVGYKYEKP